MSQPSTGHQGEPSDRVPYPPQTYGQPQPFGQPQKNDHPFATPAPAMPQQTSGAGIQPYYPATAPTHYARPHAPAPYTNPYAIPPATQYSLVSAGGRFGALLLDGLLILITLWIGWFVWAMITWADGQSPAKKLLGQVVADANTGEPFDWGRMALREFCIKGLLGWLLNLVTFGIYFLVDSFMIFGDRQRTLHDRMANSIVRHV
jgi:uncharacterized RDD family membrane protein YckC